VKLKSLTTMDAGGMIAGGCCGRRWSNRGYKVHGVVDL